MPAKKPKEITEDKPVKAKSLAKLAFEKVIEVYKLQNPAKYELKKEALQAKLETL